MKINDINNERFLKFNHCNMKLVNEYFNEINNNIIPDEVSYKIYDSLESLILRKISMDIIGFPIVSYKWINPLAKWIGDKKVLEIMAGTGSISYALKQKGIDVIATDNFSKKFKKRWTNIENIDCVDAIEKYGKDREVIIMSWPDINNTAYNVLKKVREVNDNAIIIYIGEIYGCTASDCFFEVMREIKDEKFLKVQQNYKSWFGVRDKIFLVK